MAEAVGDTGFSLKCIKDKKVPIGGTVVIAALLLAIIALAAKRCPSCPSCPSPTLPSCLDNGIGYRQKCFYFMEDKADWNRSQISCLALGAQLATIDTWEELRFLRRCGSSAHYWVGLRREGSGPWQWLNGSLLTNLLDVQGRGRCAYMDSAGLSSDWCSQLKPSLCSHPQKPPRRIQRGSEILNSTWNVPLSTGGQPEAAINPPGHGSECAKGGFGAPV
ncbi:C-type lectin domain family 2 member D-like [Dryobates pubescens]|uniref:C-type lectin domain family 2 member D-like n=1 Tax=Dryobates pubescens TaxID=118200 RepID=UPI0023B8ACE1|nr:C-type lectin domain family 2 member D-like [Dryobates pubescens]